MDDNKIILIKGNGSQWYEQAIFILKKSSPAKKLPTNLVVEAEKIINDYMFKYTYKPNAKMETLKTAVLTKEPTFVKKKNDVTTTIILNLCLILSSILLGYVIYKLMI